MFTHNGSRGKFDGFSKKRDVTGRPIQNDTGENEWCEKTGIRMEIVEHESGDRKEWKVEVDHQRDGQTEEIKCTSSVQGSQSIGRDD
jgi:hypothetical protein